MKKLFVLIVAILTFAGCELDPNIKYYQSPKIENIALSHDLATVTANDDVSVMAEVTSPFGSGFVCVKYWIGTNTWGDNTPELRFNPKNQELQIKVEPQAEGEEATWKKLASIQHTETITIEQGKPFTLEAVIPRQKAGKFVMFTVYCTSEYGIFTYSDYYSYTVQP